MKVKPSNISKTTAATLIALSLAVLPSAMPAEAQTNSDPAQNNTNSNGAVVDRTPFQESKERQQSLGCFGFVGHPWFGESVSQG
jgi:hypothetical protein